MHGLNTTRRLHISSPCPRREKACLFHDHIFNIRNRLRRASTLQGPVPLGEAMHGCIDRYDLLQNIRCDCLQFCMAIHLCLHSTYTGPILRTGTGACPYVRTYSISTGSCRGNRLWLPVIVNNIDQHSPQKRCG